MLAKRASPAYVIEYGSMPLIIFPSSINRGDLVDVSAIGDSFAKFININDGTLHDCEKYRSDYLQYVNRI